LFGEPDAQAAHALEYCWKCIFVALSNWNNSLVKTVPSIWVRCYSGNKQRPYRIYRGIQAALHWKREEYVEQ
jgi:hypothetical protein